MDKERRREGETEGADIHCLAFSPSLYPAFSPFLRKAHNNCRCRAWATACVRLATLSLPKI